MKADRRTFFQVLLEQERKPLDPMELVYPKEIPMFEKYDEYLPDILIKRDLPAACWASTKCGSASAAGKSIHNRR